VFLNNGNGTFQDAVYYSAGYLPNGIYAADLDIDSNSDLMVANQGDNALVLLNNGDGTFQEAVAYGAGYWPQSVFAADLDGDTDNDMVVANKNSDNVSVFINLSITTGLDNSPIMIQPVNFNISQNYPNPFNQTTTIKFQNQELSFVTMKVFDVLGNVVEILLNEELPTGEYEVEFEAAGLPAGVYYYGLTVGKFSQTKKMILMR